MNVFKTGAKLSGSIIVAAVLALFLCVSINVICTGLFTEYIGYNAYVYTKDGDEPIDEYQYLYTDTDGDGKDNGTDTKKVDYEEQGYTVTTYKVRSTLGGVGKVVFLSVTQVLNLILIIAFASGSVYKQGFKDANLSFMTLKVKVEFEDGVDADKVIQQARTNCKKIEDEFEIYI